MRNEEISEKLANYYFRGVDYENFEKFVEWLIKYDKRFNSKFTCFEETDSPLLGKSLFNEMFDEVLDELLEFDTSYEIRSNNSTTGNAVTYYYEKKYEFDDVSKEYKVIIIF